MGLPSLLGGAAAWFEVVDARAGCEGRSDDLKYGGRRLSGHLDRGQRRAGGTEGRIDRGSAMGLIPLSET